MAVGHRLGALIIVATGLGLRLGEARGLRWVSLTLGTYAHVLPSLQADAARKLDEILSP